MAKQRFIKSVIAASKEDSVMLPWAQKRLGGAAMSKPAASAFARAA